LNKNQYINKMNEYTYELELIAKSIEQVPYLARIMRIDNYSLYGSLVRRLIEVCVVEKRVLRAEEVREWLKIHDIDILVTKTESAAELVEFLSTVMESYSYNGFDYSDDNERIPQSTDFDNYKFKIGNHSYCLKGGIRFDVSISNGRAQSIGVDFTCNSFKIRYFASDMAYNRRYNVSGTTRGYVREKTRDEHCKFNIACNWLEKDMSRAIEHVANRKIQLASSRGNFKVWYRMVKLTEYGYSVDYSKSKELIDFALRTIEGFYHSITGIYFGGGGKQFINIEGTQTHVKCVFVNPRVQSIILRAFSQIPIQEIFLKVLKYSILVEVLEKTWCSALVSDVADFSRIRGSAAEKTRRVICKFHEIFCELNKYDVIINKIYSKTIRRPYLLESVKCLCFIFRYLYNLFMWKNKQITYEQFIEKIAETGIEDRKEEEYSTQNILDFRIYHIDNERRIKDALNFAKLREISEMPVGENAEYEIVRDDDSKSYYTGYLIKYKDLDRQRLEDELSIFTKLTLFPLGRS